MIATVATPGLTFDEATHTYWLDGHELPSVTQVLDANGLRSDFSRVSADVLERARQRGQAVHAATHYYDEGTLDESTVDPIVRPYLEAWKAFLHDRKVQLVALEQQIADPIYRFCGTLDRIAIIGDGRHPVVLDIKSGDASGVAYQLAAYQHLASSVGLVRAFGTERWSVQLHPDRATPYSVTPYRNPHDRKVFLSALTLTHERASLGRHWRLAA